MSDTISQSELEAYLDEALPVEEMSRIEQAIRVDSALAGRLASIHARRGSGVHSLGDIWRSRRLSCPTRQQLGSLLLGALPDEFARYVEFHIEVVGCRWCQANLADLRQQNLENRPVAALRQRKYFHSSAAYLKDMGKDSPRAKQ